MLEQVGNWVFVKTELVYTVYINVLLGRPYFFIVFDLIYIFLPRFCLHYLFQQETN
jgi:hypothetical protein